MSCDGILESFLVNYIFVAFSHIIVCFTRRPPSVRSRHAISLSLLPEHCNNLHGEVVIDITDLPDSPSPSKAPGLYLSQERFASGSNVESNLPLKDPPPARKPSPECTSPECTVYILLSLTAFLVLICCILISFFLLLHYLPCRGCVSVYE